MAGLKNKTAGTLKIFLGSSSEKKSEAEEIEKLIQAAGWEVIPWWKPGLFPPGKTVLSTLMRLAPSLDAAILIFSDDDQIWFRGGQIGSPRDNVLIEYGLFMGIVGGTEDDRVIICRIGDPKTASDLAGIIYIQYDRSNPTNLVGELYPWLENISTRSASEAHGLARIYTTNQRKELFLSGEQIVRGAENDIVLCARTPVPIVGTRPYDESDDPSDHERTQFEAYDDAIASLHADDKKKLTMVGCIDSLAIDLSTNGKEFRDRVKMRLIGLYADSDRLGKRLDIRWTAEPNITTFVAGDDNVIVWFKNTDMENVWFQCSNADFSRALKQHARRASKHIGITEILAKLDLENL